MTRERAIEVLKAWDLNWSDSFTANEFEQAFAMAISALSENKGEWIPDHTVFTKCSCCGWYMRTECFKPYRPKSYHFCPNCRASMKGGE